jgi:hypothetical protein
MGVIVFAVDPVAVLLIKAVSCRSCACPGIASTIQSGSDGRIDLATHAQIAAFTGAFTISGVGS